MCKGSEHISAKTKVIDKPEHKYFCRSCGSARGNNLNGEQHGNSREDCASYKAKEEKCNFLSDK